MKALVHGLRVEEVFDEREGFRALPLFGSQDSLVQVAREYPRSRVWLDFWPFAFERVLPVHPGGDRNVNRVAAKMLRFFLGECRW